MNLAQNSQSPAAKILNDCNREDTSQEQLLLLEAIPQKVPDGHGPHWQVRDSKPTPFVSDFFLSHPNKVLGI